MHGKNTPELILAIEQAELKLKSCPFCGGKAEIENTHTPSYWVQCIDCDVQISDQMTHELYDDVLTHKVSINNAVKAWNTRVSVSKGKKLLA